MSREKRKVKIKLPSGSKMSIEIPESIKEIIGYDTSKIPLKENILESYVGEKVLIKSGILTNDSIAGTIYAVAHDRLVIKLDSRDVEWYGLLNTTDFVFKKDDNVLSDLGIEAILK